MRKKINGEVERRVNMALMARQIAQVHRAICTDEEGNEGWLTARVNKNTSDIHQIKTVWSVVTGFIALISGWIGRKLG